MKLMGVDHIIRRYHANVDLISREIINVYAVGIGGNRLVARRIVRGDRDLHVHITVNRYAVVGKV